MTRNIKGYRTSRDYGKLWDLAQAQSVICTARDHQITGEAGVEGRDICRTLSSKGLTTVGCRGTCYANGETRAEFAEGCEAAGIEWIEPGEGWTRADPEAPPVDGWYWVTTAPAQDAYIVVVYGGCVVVALHRVVKTPIPWAEFTNPEYDDWHFGPSYPCPCPDTRRICGWYTPANFPGSMPYPEGDNR